MINNYVSLIYKLKKNWKVFTSKSVGTGPSSYEKKYLPDRGLKKVGDEAWSVLDIRKMGVECPSNISG